jgi:hypothetical protein
VEGKTEFPDFERLIEKEIPIVYHEEYYHQMRLFIGPSIAVLGILPLFLFRMTWGELQTFGLVATLFGIILTIRSFVLYRSLHREYSYKGVSRQTITEAIMFLDLRFVQPEKPKSPVSVLMKLRLYRYDLGMFRRKFHKLVICTIGLITWPSKLIDELEREVQDEKKTLRPCLITVLLFFLVISIITYFANTLGGWLLFIPVLLFICSFQTIISYFRYLYDRKHMYRGNLIHQVQKSESIQLEETIDEIFNILQSEYLYPLRFYLTGEYPKLTYTGRTVTSYAFNPLKEAILYPQTGPLTVLKEKEESTGAE